jgi:hypothetical protein
MGLFCHNEVQSGSSFSKFSFWEIKKLMEELEYRRPPEFNYSSENSTLSFIQLAPNFIFHARRDSSNILTAVKFILECGCGSNSSIAYDSSSSDCRKPCTTSNCAVCFHDSLTCQECVQGYHLGS